MNMSLHLPDYFIADLPKEAVVNGDLISQACQTLKENRERYLANRTTHSLVDAFCELGKSWMNPDFPFRAELMEESEEKTGFSKPVLTSGLDAFFSCFTQEQISAWIEQDLGHIERLDRMTASSAEQFTQRRSMVHGPELIGHITAGNLPVSAIMSILQGLLVRSAQFVKCASGASHAVRLFAHSLYEIEPKLGACLEIAEWPGGDETLENVLFNEADVVTASGNDETMESIQKRIPLKTRFIKYGHRVSFGFITNRALNGMGGSQVIRDAVLDVIAWNQLGCLSPHLFYVERGNGGAGELFAEKLAGELAVHEKSHPRGAISTGAAASINARRKMYEIRAACSNDTRFWYSHNSTAWSVVYEADIRFQVSCLNRFVYVKQVENLEEAFNAADPFRDKISTLGIAATEDEMLKLSVQAARWGVSRVCPLGRMQHPKLPWRHDGRPGLADLIRWTDWEL